jgi:uncharacterized membrane protein (DUF2068 family)
MTNVVESRRHWHLETAVCAVRGHFAPAATVRHLRPADADAGLDCGDRRFARCLRCDAWIVPGPDVQTTADYMPALDEIELPRRGRELRDAVVLRLIAVNRAIHSVVFGLVAVALLFVELKLGPVKAWAARVLRSLDSAVSNTGQGSSQSFFARELRKVLGLHQGTLKVLIVTASIYCVIEGVEAVGLWRERRWAEYLTAVATAGFLPFEIHELSKRVTVLRVTALVVNLLILGYLVYAKRLFGIRGGKEADVEATLEDA